MVDTLWRRSDDVRVYGVIKKFILKKCNSRAKKVQVNEIIRIIKTDRLLVVNTSLNSTFEHSN